MTAFGLTVEQKREHVVAYFQCVYGGKARYLREHGIGIWQLKAWRAQMYAGTLEVGLVPRAGVANVPEANQEIVRLTKEVRRLREQLDAQAVAHREQTQAAQHELVMTQGFVESLGKAIAYAGDRVCQVPVGLSR